MPIDILGGTAIKPVERHGLDAVKWFLYDQNTGAIMGRTPKSWLLITLFYIVYYSLLAAFWALCLFIFFTIAIDSKTPTWTTTGSLIGSSPAMGVRPEQSWKMIDSSMIIFNQAREGNVEGDDIPGWGEWRDRMKTFYESYADVNQTGEICPDNPKAGTACKFDLKQLGGCAKGNFGYEKGKPCVILKLNKIYDLQHEYYNDSTTLPEHVPNRVRKTMKGLSGHKLNQVWVDCHGENAADIEGIGEIDYFPKTAAFPSKYFPYVNQDGYVSPLVAVQFLNPTAGQLLHIECRAYAGNIGYNKRDKIGRAHFELLVHNKFTAAGPQ